MRWTPYRFSDSSRDKMMRYHFRYGPVEPNTSKEAKIQHKVTAYTNSIKFEQIRVDCFLVSVSNPHNTPSNNESLLLTIYLKNTGSLPLTNNEL